MERCEICGGPSRPMYKESRKQPVFHGCVRLRTTSLAWWRHQLASQVVVLLWGVALRFAMAQRRRLPFERCTLVVAGCDFFWLSGCWATRSSNTRACWLACLPQAPNPYTTNPPQQVKRACHSTMSLYRFFSWLSPPSQVSPFFCSCDFEVTHES